ncbi:hypothetical protein [Nocardiopsis metallicus]|uniref:Serine/threonine protein kinase n=1 Tax=Nocardiopsis metallicus TaxID=179819 RepID=A0A840W9Q9_9ACTN|nr:serine/threonine protein kinase [Nocardiopsis metallicus]
MPTSPDPPAGVLALDPSDPRHLGPFRLVGRLGAGGMGVVYAGLDDRHRRVAVKCVHRSHAADREFRARFAREVTVTTTRDHAFEEREIHIPDESEILPDRPTPGA